MHPVLRSGRTQREAWAGAVRSLFHPPPRLASSRRTPGGSAPAGMADAQALPTLPLAARAARRRRSEQAETRHLCMLGQGTLCTAVSTMDAPSCSPDRAWPRRGSTRAQRGCKHFAAGDWRAGTAGERPGTGAGVASTGGRPSGSTAACTSRWRCTRRSPPTPGSPGRGPRTACCCRPPAPASPSPPLAPGPCTLERRSPLQLRPTPHEHAAVCICPEFIALDTHEQRSHKRRAQRGRTPGTLKTTRHRSQPATTSR